MNAMNPHPTVVLWSINCHKMSGQFSSVVIWMKVIIAPRSVPKNLLRHITICKNETIIGAHIPWLPWHWGYGAHVPWHYQFGPPYFKKLRKSRARLCRGVFCKQLVIVQNVSRSTRFAMFCTALTSFIQETFVNMFAYTSSKCWICFLQKIGVGDAFF